MGGLFGASVFLAHVFVIETHSQQENAQKYARSEKSISKMPENARKPFLEYPELPGNTLEILWKYFGHTLDTLRALLRPNLSLTRHSNKPKTSPL